MKTVKGKTFKDFIKCIISVDALQMFVGITFNYYRKGGFRCLIEIELTKAPHIIGCKVTFAKYRHFLPTRKLHSLKRRFYNHYYCCFFSENSSSKIHYYLLCLHTVCIQLLGNSGNTVTVQCIHNRLK